MHTRGRGEVVPPATTYGDLCAEVKKELLDAVARAEAAGIERSKIWIDPGLGFAKTAKQSTLLFSQLPRLVELGFPVLVGASRKGFLAELAQRSDGSRPSPLEREPASTAAVVLAVLRGAAALRVHDVAAAWQAVQVTSAVSQLGAATC
jgi:dihydropteroate synthase